jgi:ABC-type nitrate/sulfonate/bicarbonate transport system permease component
MKSSVNIAQQPTQAPSEGRQAENAADSFEVLKRTPVSPRFPLVEQMAGSTVEHVILWIISALIAIAIWEVIADLIVKNPLFFPSFGEVVKHAWQLYVVDRSIYADFLVTAKETAIGFVISMIGIPLGLLVGLSRRAAIMFEPLATAIYALPHIALVPLAIVWFGLGLWAKVFMVFVSVFFLIFINTIAGVVTVDRDLRDVAHVYRASWWRTFWTIILPGSVPFIFSGLRLGIGRALVGVVAAELFASNSGLGYLLGVFGNNFDTANLFVIIATFAIVGVALTALVGLPARYFDRWRLE